MEEHTQFALTLTHYLSLATILGGMFVALLVLFTAHALYTKRHYFFMDRIRKHMFALGFFVTLGGVFLTLFYSEYLGYAPCDLCWYQRVFLYPQVFMFVYAWYKRDTGVFPYTLLLSVFGFCIALYHHFLQMGFDLMKPCSSAPFAVDCSKPSFIEFGFVTFPFMAVVLFAFLATLSVLTISRNKH